MQNQYDFANDTENRECRVRFRYACRLIAFVRLNKLRVQSKQFVAEI